MTTPVLSSGAAYAHQKVVLAQGLREHVGRMSKLQQVRLEVWNRLNKVSAETHQNLLALQAEEMRRVEASHARVEELLAFTKKISSGEHDLDGIALPAAVTAPPGALPAETFFDPHTAIDAVIGHEMSQGLSRQLAQELVATHLFLLAQAAAFGALRTVAGETKSHELKKAAKEYERVTKNFLAGDAELAGLENEDALSKLSNDILDHVFEGKIESTISPPTRISFEQYLRILKHEQNFHGLQFYIDEVEYKIFESIYASIYDSLSESGQVSVKDMYDSAVKHITLRLESLNYLKSIKILNNYENSNQYNQKLGGYIRYIVPKFEYDFKKSLNILRSEFTSYLNLVMNSEQPYEGLMKLVNLYGIVYQTYNDTQDKPNLSDFKNKLESLLEQTCRSMPARKFRLRRPSSEWVWIASKYHKSMYMPREIETCSEDPCPQIIGFENVLLDGLFRKERDTYRYYSVKPTHTFQFKFGRFAKEKIKFSDYDNMALFH
jgi:hypothetical protein